MSREKLVAFLVSLSFGLSFDGGEEIRAAVEDYLASFDVCPNSGVVDTDAILSALPAYLRGVSTPMDKLAARVRVVELHSLFPKRAFGGSVLDSSVVHARDFDYDETTLDSFESARRLERVAPHRPQHVLAAMILRRCDGDHELAACAYRRMTLKKHDALAPEEIIDAVDEAVGEFRDKENVDPNADE